MHTSSAEKYYNVSVIFIGGLKDSDTKLYQKDVHPIKMLRTFYFKVLETTSRWEMLAVPKPRDQAQVYF